MIDGCHYIRNNVGDIVAERRYTNEPKNLG